MIHVIKPGDNLYQLSRKYRVPLALILRANPYVDVYNLRPGQEICIPMYRQPGPRPFPGHRPMPGRPEPGPMPERPTPGGSMPGRPEPRDMGEFAEEDMDERESMDGYEEAYGQEERAEENLYHSDGTKSLGMILKECGMSVNEFFERNDPDQIIIAPDVMLDVPKRV